MDPTQSMQALRKVATEAELLGPAKPSFLAAGLHTGAIGLQTGAAGLHTGYESVLDVVEDDSRWHPLLRRLRLGHKFTVMLVLSFLVGATIAGVKLHQVLQERAEAEVVSRSGL